MPETYEKVVDPSTPIQFKGVVYNEMKGQTVSFLYQQGVRSLMQILVRLQLLVLLPCRASNASWYKL